MNAKDLKTYFKIEQFNVINEEKIDSCIMRGDEILNWAQHIYRWKNGYSPSSRISLKGCIEIISEELIGYVTFTKIKEYETIYAALAGGGT